MGAFMGKGFFNEPHRDTMAVSGLTGATVGLMSMASSQNLALAALLSIAAQFGMQFWVAFWAGPTMIFNLEKPTFASIQSKLFPKFGLVGVSTSVIAFAGHYFNSRGSFSFFDHNSVLLSTILNIHLFNYLLSTPKQVSMLAVMYDEGADDGARAKARRTFGMYHGVSMLSTFACMAVNVAFFHSATRAIGADW